MNKTASEILSSLRSVYTCDVGNVLFSVRKSMGITRKTLSALSGVHESTIYHIEHKHQGGSLDTLYALFKSLSELEKTED